MIEELLAKFLGPQGMQQFMQFAAQQQAPGLLGPAPGGPSAATPTTMAPDATGTVYDGASPPVPNMHHREATGRTPSAMYPDDTGTYNEGLTPRTIPALRRK